ncbi:unnamed protein product [Mytilus edulis]|uniref:Uncharacterized protein n=1 Tax=Mytilus edulis TaxID=6550 RepID=A0A8S3UYI8_MYTED|nr:unnamed protein product [Mytilus edulis]
MSIRNHSGRAHARAVRMQESLGGLVVVTPSREWAFSHLTHQSWIKPTTGEGSGGKNLSRKDLWRITVLLEVPAIPTVSASGDVTATDFVLWLQRHACIPEGVRIQGVDMPPDQAVCSAMNWQMRRVYTINPFNSQVVVLYWRVMLSLLRYLSQANRITIAMDEYTGTTVPHTRTSEEGAQGNRECGEKRSGGRGIYPIEESPVVLLYHNTRKMVTVITVQSAVQEAKDLFDLEEEEVVLTYLVSEITLGVTLELLPAVAELHVVV